MRFGVSYFGVCNPHHTERDLDEMVQVTQVAAGYGLSNVVCVQPIGSTRGFCEALLRSCKRHGKTPQMWIQGFGVWAGDEPLLGQEMELMATCGVADIAIWSYLATAYMSSHVCADSEGVWHVVTQAMQDLRVTLAN